MASRRQFLHTTVGAIAAAATPRVFATGARIQGTNSRVRMGVIGMGNRAARVFDSFGRHADVQWVAGCEVNQTKLQNFLTPARQTFGLQIVGDYRRLLDRRDIDAVLIGTPDFSHAKIMVDAVEAGKDVYVEKPASNTVTRVNAMLDAARATKRIVQVGTQQRSWDHFVQAKELLESGVLGRITQVRIVQPGSYANSRQAPQPVPPGLDWPMWQMLGLPLGAPERPFSPNRLGFRAWYEYGSGLIGDWGAHHVDVAHWFMNADTKVPIKTSAVGSFMTTQNPDPEQVPDTFSVAWEYDTFVMSFANGEDARDPDDLEGWGVFFMSNQGSLQVNRMGWALRPSVPKTRNKVTPPPSPTLGGVAVAGQPAGAGPGAGRGSVPAATPIEKKVYINPRGGVEEDYPLDAHTRNFLDCLQSRRPPHASLEIGYNAALPCLLALESLKQGRTLGWDAEARRPKAL